ncbi:small GTPase superfamily [Purpureocillium lavendulum]|uniref:Small GTPase superfamily n=1 Tax=Purpureocillium lavendulum TaxID=1247861 RepID=A0AB34FQW8_9HYPO|nr:small GTPase superfamily [Purpureocillium lavendulum]
MNAPARVAALIDPRADVATAAPAVPGRRGRGEVALLRDELQQLVGEQLVHLALAPQLPQPVDDAELAVLVGRVLVADVDPPQRVGALRDDGGGGTTVRRGRRRGHRRKRPRLLLQVREEAVPEHERHLVGHDVARLARVAGHVEQLRDERRPLEALADEEEQRHHVPDLVPEEGRPADVEVVDLGVQLSVASSADDARRGREARLPQRLAASRIASMSSHPVLTPPPPPPPAAVPDDGSGVKAGCPVEDPGVAELVLGVVERLRRRFLSIILFHLHLVRPRLDGRSLRRHRRRAVVVAVRQLRPLLGQRPVAAHPQPDDLAKGAHATVRPPALGVLAAVELHDALVLGEDEARLGQGVPQLLLDGRLVAHGLELEPAVVLAQVRELQGDEPCRVPRRVHLALPLGRLRRPLALFCGRAILGRGARALCFFRLHRLRRSFGCRARVELGLKLLDSLDEARLGPGVVVALAGHVCVRVRPARESHALGVGGRGKCPKSCARIARKRDAFPVLALIFITCLADNPRLPALRAMDPEVVKLLLVGDEKCGKTTFLSRLSAGERTNPIPLLRDIDQPYIFNANLGDKKFRLEFYDTSCPDNWRLLDPDVVVICYDISQRLSLINMKRYWLDEVKRAFTRRDSLPVVILGLKRDLRSETDPNGIIYPQEAYQVAQTMRADRYVECSAVTGELVKLAFEDICKTATATTTAAGGTSDGGCTVL